jgi:hypothetical protein
MSNRTSRRCMRCSSALSRFTGEASCLPAFCRFGKRLALFPIIGYGLAIGLSFVNTWISVLLYALVPVPYILGLLYRGLGNASRGDNEGKASSDHPADEQAGTH